MGMNDLLNLDYCNSTLDLKKNIESSFLELGERLLKIRNEQTYRPQWDSFPEFVWEMRWSESQASKLINIYQKFVLEYSFPTPKLLAAGGWSVLAEILPMIKSKVDAVRWLDIATTKARHDLRADMKEEKTGVLQPECPHGDTYELRICNACGLKTKIYSEE